MALLYLASLAPVIIPTQLPDIAAYFAFAAYNVIRY